MVQHIQNIDISGISPQNVSSTTNNEDLDQQMNASSSKAFLSPDLVPVSRDAAMNDSMMTQEEVVHVPKVIPQERVQQRTVERIVDVSAP